MAKTKDDPRFNIPEGHHPGEFLDDAGLADYYAHQLELNPDDPEAKRAAARAQVAAALTSASVLETEAAGAAELAADKQ